MEFEFQFWITIKVVFLFTFLAIPLNILVQNSICDWNDLTFSISFKKFRIKMILPGYHEELLNDIR